MYLYKTQNALLLVIQSSLPEHGLEFVRVTVKMRHEFSQRLLCATRSLFLVLSYTKLRTKRPLEWSGVVKFFQNSRHAVSTGENQHSDLPGIPVLIQSRQENKKGQTIPHPSYKNL